MVRPNPFFFLLCLLQLKVESDGVHTHEQKSQGPPPAVAMMRTPFLVFTNARSGCSCCCLLD